MKFLMREIQAVLPPLGATKDIPLEEKIVICKYYTPKSDLAWYVFEGQPLEDDPNDFIFYGTCNQCGNKLGYFSTKFFQGLQEFNAFLTVKCDTSVYMTPYKNF